VVGLQLKDAPYDCPPASELLGRLFEHYRQQYPDAGAGPPRRADPRAEAARYEPPEGAFLLAVLDGANIGCGGLRRCEAGEGIAELKRMWVEPPVRRTGVAQALLDELERRAVELGYRAMWLDTGPRQRAAIRFYERNGYRPIPNYGTYASNLVLVSFAKQLVPETVA
jgi:GNAT superfamily N-acetyltransferase